MKRTISLILAALLLASSLTACGKTEPDETTGGTTAVETNAPATDPVETDAPAPSYSTDRLTENGMANAHIVLSDTADTNEKLAAEELQYHIKKVSGAEVSIVNTPTSDSIPVYIGTPDSIPELAELFPEDIAWLTTLEEDGKRFGDDGFAIRTTEKAIYIFGATSKGALNGVYDFIEENLGVLWIRADEEKGLIYEEMPTITLTSVDYREKSPFDVRALCFYGGGENQRTTEKMYIRNKINGFNAPFDGPGYWEVWDSMGADALVSNHNIKQLVLKSPLYDPTNNEYWETDPEGNHLTYETSMQVNIWSDLVADTVAATVIASLDSSEVPVEHFGICLQDTLMNWVYPECTEPFEYAPGQFIEPNYDYTSDYYSTVFFTFLNKVADQVAEKYPDVMLHTYAYYQTLNPPRCELRDNIAVVFCTINEDLTQPYNEPHGQYPELDWEMLQKWLEKTDKLIMYGYYGCCYTAGWYERPIWDRMQDDLQYYASKGLIGLLPCGYYDTPTDYILDRFNWGCTIEDVWDTNMLTYWLLAKLAWNPYEDVDALIEYFCDKVYRDAADEMMEYYRILKMGWDDGAETLYSMFNANIRWNSPTMDIYYNFLDTTVDDIYIIEGLGEALDKAWEAADDRAKEFIARRRECLTVDAWEGFLAYTQNFK